MSRKSKGKNPSTLLQAAKEFLTPTVFRQAHQPKRSRQERRWCPSNLIYVALLMAWCSGDSLPERFETAKSFYVVSFPKRKRPGKSYAGYQKAISALPMAVLRAVAAGVRQQIPQAFAERWLTHGFVAFGCDGSSHECSRGDELERRLGSNSKSNASPTLWNTTIVHLATGIPWCWRWGRGAKASERDHLSIMIPLLPRLTLLVADAGYISFELMQRLIDASLFFLMRMPSTATFYSDSFEPIEDYTEGWVYYWPIKRQEKKLSPIRGRLLRIRNPKWKADVWLFTNATEHQLPIKIAGKFYRWRWGNEGFFRTYKRTLKKFKMESHSVRLVHREAETTMIAMQLMLCIGMRQMPVANSAEETPQTPNLCSPRKVLLKVRLAIQAGDREKKDFWRKLAQATLDRRPRTTPKEKRVWPRRKPHIPPKPPTILTITLEQKRLLAQLLVAV